VTSHTRETSRCDLSHWGQGKGTPGRPQCCAQQPQGPLQTQGCCTITPSVCVFFVAMSAPQRTHRLAGIVGQQLPCTGALSRTRCKPPQHTEKHPPNLCPHLAPLTPRNTPPQSLSSLTLNPKPPCPAPQVESLWGRRSSSSSSRLHLHYSFPPFSVGELGKQGPPNRREVGHGNLARAGLTGTTHTPLAALQYKLSLSQCLLQQQFWLCVHSTC